MALTNWFSLFGIEFKKNDTKKDELESFVPKIDDSGAIIVAEGGSHSQFLDLEGTAKTEAELIARYREMSLHPEVDTAIDDIINEIIVVDPKEEIVKINLDKIDYSNDLKKKITTEFKVIQDLFEFNNQAYEIAKRWYIDGRLYYHCIVDNKKLKEGIQELRYIDPRKIRKVRQVKRLQQAQLSGNFAVKNAKEYYVFNDRGFGQAAGTAISISSGSVIGLKIAKDSIIHATSGLTDVNSSTVLSYLHKAIKPLNQLRVMEDALVIYRISRAPERRVFYIDVGSLPKLKAEQYIREMMAKFKNKLSYNSQTGEVTDDRKFMTMLEDFWLPRRGGTEGDRGTKIEQLPSGGNLGEITDIEYFQKKLYKSLNVPTSRLASEGGFNLGRASEISRDEVKFNKFVTRLRSKFSTLFIKSLEKQLILKNIVALEDWESISNKISFDYNMDNQFAQLKELEVLKEKLDILQGVDAFVGKYFSTDWIKTHILGFSKEEQEDMEKEMQADQEKMSTDLEETGAPSPEMTGKEDLNPPIEGPVPEPGMPIRKSGLKSPLKAKVKPGIPQQRIKERGKAS